MSRHTPGPWEFDKDSGDYPKSISSEEGDVIWGCGCCGSPNMGIDDARLIAAAPDLLEALECLLEKTDREWGKVGDPGIWLETRNNALAAITKARGEL